MIHLKDKFIFIHVHKVAGKSITRALERNFLPSLINNNEYLYYHYQKRFKDKSIIIDDKKIHRHSKAIDYKNYFKEDYDNYYKFALVRNPFDWQVSMFNYMNLKKDHRQHDTIKNMSFDEYIEWRCFKDLNFQSDYVTDENNNIIVDYIGKYENFDDEIKTIEKSLGFKLKVPYINKTNHRHYSKYYNKHTVELITKYFEIDFKNFDYQESL
tara:strand:- start:922 stop:1557 length:636 start_codon:yes stop_codon:yes gene_type:complete